MLPAVRATTSLDVTSYSTGKPTTETVRACFSVLVTVVTLFGTTIIGDGLISVVAGLMEVAHPDAKSNVIPLLRSKLVVEDLFAAAENHLGQHPTTVSVWLEKMFLKLTAGSYPE